MGKFGTHHSKKNVNSLPKWARAYILTGGIEGKIMSIESLPQWARAKIIEIQKYNRACARTAREMEKEYCQERGCTRKCSKKNRDLCHELGDIPPCG